ncbi:uncharacterized protein [Neodiprion pinetum]|uniref:uncharacterized protein n=1 Tax=Neodiprion pinetum TaxID=441929 RepID=UPI003715FD00
MSSETQSTKLPVMNFDKCTQQSTKRKKRHGESVPRIVRAVFCETSNCGKPNALFALITHPTGLRFENLYVHSKSLNQPKYKFLSQVLKNVDGVEYHPSNEHEHVIASNEAQPNSIMELVNVPRGTKLVKEEVKEKLKTETKDEPKNAIKAEDSFATAEEEDQTITESSVRSKNEYLEMLNDKKRQHKLDTLYGVRSLSTARLMVGHLPISFERDSVCIGGTLYPKTQGLLELLFKKMPNSAHVTRNDKEDYRNILLATNAHRKYDRATEPIRNAQSAKFEHLIAELLNISTSGKGVSPSSQMSKRTGKDVLLPQAWVTRQVVKAYYIFWDDANELVERLCLLMASQGVRNTSHNNEIMTVLEELREAGIITLEITTEKALDTFYTDLKTGRDLSIQNTEIISKLDTRLRALEYEREKASTGDGTA